MSALAATASLVIWIAAVLTYYTALLHLTRPKAGHTYKFRILRNLLVGTQALQLGFLARGWQLERPWLLYPFITLLFVAGPLNYLRYYWFFYPGGKLPRSFIPQLLPAALVFVIETWFYALGPGRQPAEMARLFAQPFWRPASFLLLIGFAGVMVQDARLLRLELGFRHNPQMRQPVLLSSGITVASIAASALTAAGFFLVRPPILHAGILLFGLAGITYLIFENRHPRFYQLIGQEDRQQKYKRSLLQGLSRDKIMARLRELMEEEKLYRELELRLDDVAARLLITPHQLSEFVNDNLGVSFPIYVNRYRVEEARELLLRDPDRSTLAIGFEVGFGSKQTFNTSFKQQTGMTPSEYRKTYRQTHKT